MITPQLDTPHSLHAPTVSVVCCTHNREPFARSHFEAMRSHLGEDIELVYALDNCTDATHATLQALVNGHPKVRVLEHRGERGLFNCRNFGIEQARGAYIHFLETTTVSSPASMPKPLQAYRPTRLMRQTSTCPAFASPQKVATPASAN